MLTFLYGNLQFYNMKQVNPNNMVFGNNAKIGMPVDNTKDIAGNLAKNALQQTNYKNMRR